MISVLQPFKYIAHHPELTEATFVFDMLAYALVGHAKKHDSLGAMDKDRRPEFQRICGFMG